jgi:protein N-terminal amidase
VTFKLTDSGYNFKSLHQISPSLEPTEAGVSTAWARGVAKAYNCLVAVGYPETVDITEKWPADPEYYSSAVMVKPSGRVVLHYRKTHLYPTDEKWALESADGFYARSIGGLGKVAFGIGEELRLHTISITPKTHE